MILNSPYKKLSNNGGRNSPVAARCTAQVGTGHYKTAWTCTRLPSLFFSHLRRETPRALASFVNRIFLLHAVLSPVTRSTSTCIPRATEPSAAFHFFSLPHTTLIKMLQFRKLGQQDTNVIDPHFSHAGKKCLVSISEECVTMLPTTNAARTVTGIFSKKP